MVFPSGLDGGNRNHLFHARNRSGTGLGLGVAPYFQIRRRCFCRMRRQNRGNIRNSRVFKRIYRRYPDRLHLGRLFGGDLYHEFHGVALNRESPHDVRRDYVSAAGWIEH